MTAAGSVRRRGGRGSFGDGLLLGRRVRRLRPVRRPHAQAHGEQRAGRGERREDAPLDPRRSGLRRRRPACRTAARRAAAAPSRRRSRSPCRRRPAGGSLLLAARPHQEQHAGRDQQHGGLDEAERPERAQVALDELARALGHVRLLGTTAGTASPPWRPRRSPRCAARAAAHAGVRRAHDIQVCHSTGMSCTSASGGAGGSSRAMYQSSTRADGEQQLAQGVGELPRELGRDDAAHRLHERRQLREVERPPTCVLGRPARSSPSAAPRARPPRSAACCASRTSRSASSYCARSAVGLSHPRTPPPASRRRAWPRSA